MPAQRLFTPKVGMPSTAKIIAMKMRIPIFLSNDIVIYGYTSCDQR